MHFLDGTFLSTVTFSVNIDKIGLQGVHSELFVHLSTKFDKNRLSGLGTTVVNTFFSVRIFVSDFDRVTALNHPL